MKRLREEASADGVVGPAVDLVRATPATRVTSEAKRRVWAAVEAARATSPSRQRSVLVRIGWFPVTVAILCIAGTASALIQHRWISALVTRLTQPTSVSAPVAPPPAAARRRPSTATSPRASVAGPAAPVIDPAADVSADDVGSVLPAAPLIASEPRRRDGSTSARAPGLSAEKPPQQPTRSHDDAAPSSRAPSTRQHGEVLDAMVALRRDHDPARAGDMLSRYLADHPTGALREEALVLSIEAAVGRGDSAAARHFAQQYHAAFPRGRFRAFSDSYLQPAAE